MTQQIINVGTADNAGDGDTVRSAFQKSASNFSELYTAVGLAASQSDLDSLELAVDSATFSGQIYHDPASAVSVTISAAGTFAGIGGITDFTAGTMAKFSMQNDGSNRVLQYTGTATLTGVTIWASLTVVASAGTKRIEARIAKNGLVSTRACGFANSSAETQIFICDKIDLVTNDKIKIMVTNLDDTTSVNCKRLSLVV